MTRISTCGSCSGDPSCQRCREQLDAADPLVGSTLGGCYVIETRIAAGGYGVVYGARWLQPGRSDLPVAIKVVQWKHTNDAAIGARFRREAEALSNLGSKHTVHTFHRGEDRATGTQFLVMELLDGESLFARYMRGPLQWRTVLTIMRQVCESLAEAHAAGIVHRDLKPSNIFLVQKPTADFVKVLDFGIAKVADDKGPKGAPLTEIGHAIGTPEYMSPEQMLGRQLDGRSDIYTLGVVMYELIAGARPYPERDLTGLITSITTRRPMPLSTRARWPIPPALDAVIDRCLGRDAKDRYDNVKQLAHAIDQILDMRADKTTLRQWQLGDDEDERTWIPPAGGKQPSAGGGLALAEARKNEPHREAAIRAPLVETEKMKWQPLGSGNFGKRDDVVPMDVARGSLPVITPQPRRWLRVSLILLAVATGLALIGLAIGTIAATFA